MTNKNFVHNDETKAKNCANEKLGEDCVKSPDKEDEAILQHMEEWMDSISSVTETFGRRMARLCKINPFVLGYQRLLNDIWELYKRNEVFLPSIYSGATHEDAEELASHIRDSHDKILADLDFIKLCEIISDTLYADVIETLAFNSFSVDAVIEAWYDEDDCDCCCEDCEGCEGCDSADDEDSEDGCDCEDYEGCETCDSGDNRCDSCTAKGACCGLGEL